MLSSTAGVVLCALIVIAMSSFVESAKPEQKRRSAPESRKATAAELSFDTIVMEARYLHFMLKYYELVDEVALLRRLSPDHHLLTELTARLEKVRKDLEKQRRLLDRGRLLKDFRDFLTDIQIPLLLLIHKRDAYQFVYNTRGAENSQVDGATMPTDSSSELEASFTRFMGQLNETDFQSKSELFISWVCFALGLTNISIIPPESMEEVTDQSGAPLLIGEGGNGEVRLMKMKTGDQQIYAVKTQHWHLDSLSAAENFVNEVRALRALHGSQNFPTFIGVTSSQHGGHFPAIVQEFVGEVTSHQAKSISLVDAIWDLAISKSESLHIASEVSRALQTMHSKNWLHCDLKIDNILLKKSSENANDLGCYASDDAGMKCLNPKRASFTVKLVDFGTTINLNEPEEYLILDPQKQQILLELSSHIAPEVVRGQRPYSKSSDVFSLGRVLHALSLAGDDFLRHLGDKCTEPNPEDRPNLDHVIVMLDFWMKCRPV